MQALQSGVGATAEAMAAAVRVWIEDGKGSIARGMVQAITESRALVRLSEADSVHSGDEVSVRISFDRDSPTLGAAARVLRIRASGGGTECELEWTNSGPERALLSSRIATLG
jgi:hypothetical protein